MLLASVPVNTKDVCVIILVFQHWNEYIWFEMTLQTCSDHAQPYLSTRAVNIRRILDLADIRAVIDELDLLKDDGGIAAHDVTSPDDTLPENAIRWGIWPLLVVEYLKRSMH